MKILILLSLLISLRKCSGIEKHKFQKNNLNSQIQTTYEISSENSLDVKRGNTKTRNQRILQTSQTQLKDIDLSMKSFLNNYDSRVDFCHYLCQPVDIYSIMESQTCYIKYSCPTLFWKDVSIAVLFIVYAILPIFMILTGLWSFKCWGRNIAYLTGVVCLNKLYSKFSIQIEQNMQTDYEISTENPSSEQKTENQTEKRHN